MKLIEHKPCTGRLEGWYTDRSYSVLWGHIYDDIHERWPNGESIHTSHIEGVRDMDLQEGMVVQTKNSTYLLGKPLTSMIKGGILNK
jgi:hypothetical protein